MANFLGVQEAKPTTNSAAEKWGQQDLPAGRPTKRCKVIKYCCECFTQDYLFI
jgi:hypothetical protein